MKEIIICIILFFGVIGIIGAISGEPVLIVIAIGGSTFLLSLGAQV